MFEVNERIAIKQFVNYKQDKTNILKLEIFLGTVVKKYNKNTYDIKLDNIDEIKRYTNHKMCDMYKINNKY
jgi:hypothetical protein